MWFLAPWAEAGPEGAAVAQQRAGSSSWRGSSGAGGTLLAKETEHQRNFFRLLRVPRGAWGLLRLPVCCVGAVFPENACQSSCSGARDARRFSILGRLEKGL